MGARSGGGGGSRGGGGGGGVTAGTLKKDTIYKVNGKTPSQSVYVKDVWDKGGGNVGILYKLSDSTEYKQVTVPKGQTFDFSPM